MARGDSAKGLAVRQAALEILEGILVRKSLFEEGLAASKIARTLEPRDRAFASAIVLSVLRHKGEIDAVLVSFMPKPLPRKSGLTLLVFFIGIAQLLFLDVAPHAAIDLCVSLARLDRGAAHFTGLVNAVLRRVAEKGRERLETLDGAVLNTPDWLWQRWVRSHGEEQARLIAASHLVEPQLDVSVASLPLEWSVRLGGTLLPGGSIRLPLGAGPVDELPGYSGGGWWIQDAASALPVRLLGDVAGQKVIDLCAAPGGKTMQLCAAGADVTAVDLSDERLDRLRENLERQKFKANVIAADALALDMPGQFDGVVLDAPCSATGTLRRHPELPYIRDGLDIGPLVKLQTRMLKAAARLVKPGGLLIYCTCSLEIEEGEKQIEGFLSAFGKDFELTPVRPVEDGFESNFVTVEGYLRTLPFMTIGTKSGLDGFFAARLKRKG